MSFFMKFFAFKAIAFSLYSCLHTKQRLSEEAPPLFESCFTRQPQEATAAPVRHHSLDGGADELINETIQALLHNEAMPRLYCLLMEVKDGEQLLHRLHA